MANADVDIRAAPSADGLNEKSTSKNIMKTKSLGSGIFKTMATLAIAGLALASVNEAKAVIINYASAPGTINPIVTGALIDFDGLNNFSFTPGPTGPANIAISNGTAAGFTGVIAGAFSIGAPVISGGSQIAPVTGVGTFTINDGLTPFTASLTWVDISSFGVFGGLNAGGSANLTGVSYLGTNPDLVALAVQGIASNSLTFQFATPYTVTQLKTTDIETSYSGTLTSVPDGGMTVALFGLSLIGLTGVRRFVK
jgi:hypothetical protein